MATKMLFRPPRPKANSLFPGDKPALGRVGVHAEVTEALDAWNLRAAVPPPGRLKTCQAVLLLPIIALWSCTLSPPPGYRYQGGLNEAPPLTKVSLASPRVGTVVMMRAVGDAATLGDAFVGAFKTALADTLRAKGYEPVALYSGVFNEGIGGLGPFKHLRAMRPMLQEPVFAKPTAREVAGVFVAWVEVHFGKPYIGSPISAGTTGDTPTPNGHMFIEMFTPEGEPLTWTEGIFLGYEIQAGTTYRVLTPEEIAPRLVENALAQLRPHGSPR
jgi:hypothetical protein